MDEGGEQSSSTSGASAQPGPTPAAHGPPLFRAALRRAPEDFRVDERLAIVPEEAGEHLWLRLEKRLLDTAAVAALIGRVYEVGSADIGLSGLKDRRAVTRQWFSVRTPRGPEPLERALTERASAPSSGALEGEGAGEGAGEGGSLVLLEARRHSRKLRRGTHVANAFEIVLRDVAAPAPFGGAAGVPEHGAPEARGGRAGERDGSGGRGETREPAFVDALGRALQGRVARLRADGFPNYLGPQRFGRDGRNVERARAWFRRPRRRVGRLQRGLWLSAARGALFNRVCAARVGAESWARLLEGEPVVLDGSRSYFVIGEDGEGGADGSRGERSLAERLAGGDVHPSGPWWGRGASPARGACEAFERAALEGCEELCDGLERAGLVQERRALRALPCELAHERPDAATLRLTFTLPPGVYATTLLAELGDCRVEPVR